MREEMKEMRREGFTLVEILLVVAIIGLLAAMVAPNLVGRGRNARRTVARVDIEANLAAALDLYEMDNGMYPTTDQGLEALLRRPSRPPEPVGWSGPYLKRARLPKDPWGRAYVYRSPVRGGPEGYELYSLGPDGIESADDIGREGTARVVSEGGADAAWEDL